MNVFSCLHENGRSLQLTKGHNKSKEDKVLNKRLPSVKYYINISVSTLMEARGKSWARGSTLITIISGHLKTISEQRLNWRRDKVKENFPLKAILKENSRYIEDTVSTLR